MPDPTEAALAQAIRLLQRPGFEPALAALFAHMVAPDNLIVLAFPPAGPPAVLFRQSAGPQVFGRLESDYMSGAYLLDPYHALAQRRAPAGLYRLHDVAPDAFPRSRYYTEYYRQTGLIDELAYLAYPAPGLSLTLCLGRDGASGRAFSPAEIQACRRLAPVILALVERHWAGLAPAGTGAAAPAWHQALSARGLALTPRQAEVALMILQGHSTGAIGLVLGLSPQTVKVFRRQLYQRCGVSSQAELFALLLPLLRPA